MELALIAFLRRIENHESADCMTIAVHAAKLFLEIDRHTLLGISAEKRTAGLELEGFESATSQPAPLVNTPA